jgi:hypothetical protein
MPTPAYSGGIYSVGWGTRGWTQTSAPANNGWLGRVGAWFDGAAPQYAEAGQASLHPVKRGAPVYHLAPLTTTADAATSTPQAAPTPSVLVVPRT